MECIEARALKSSLLSEIALISTQKQVCFDDVRGLGSVTCDDIWVDELFDFSDKGLEDGFSQESSEEDEAKDSFSLSSQQRSFNSDSFSNHHTNFGHLPEGELALPKENNFLQVDDMENLEWLSQIVDDSETEISLLCPVGSLNVGSETSPEKQCEPMIRPAVERVREPCFPLPACRKRRGKRSRPNGRVFWPHGSPSLTPESSSTTSYSSYGSSTISPFVGLGNPVEEAETFSGVEKPAAKKQKKRPAGDSGSGCGGSQSMRRCSHCQVQKTPQWRTGPLGPKTLCNACGVRYKSGRLFPEYRPACSPTFSREIHSNSHRKVLEMRRVKEMGGPIETGPTPMLPSF